MNSHEDYKFGGNREYDNYDNYPQIAYIPRLASQYRVMSPRHNISSIPQGFYVVNWTDSNNYLNGENSKHLELKDFQLKQI